MKNTLPLGMVAIDKTVIKGRLEKLSPLEKGMQALLVPDRNHRSDRDQEEQSKPDYRKVKRLSDIISNNMKGSTDLRSITQLIKRGEQIWVTLLLKPNGDQRDLLSYKTDSTDIKNMELHTALLKQVENYFSNQYPIEDYLAQIIKEVLFRSGSYTILNMSHSVLDHLINGYEVGGQEALLKTQQIIKDNFVPGSGRAKNRGYIRKDPLPDNQFSGMEALYSNLPAAGEEYNLVDSRLKWTFTDNLVVLKAAELERVSRETRMRKITGSETLQTVMGRVFETQKKPPTGDAARKRANNNHVGVANKTDLNAEIRRLYPNRNYRTNESLSVRRSQNYTGNGRGVGITYHVPSEAVIPVHANGEIGKPFGFIMLVDPKTGEWLKTASDWKFYQRGNKTTGVDTKPGSGSLNEMIGHIKTIAQGGDCDINMDWMVELSSAQLEKEFIEGFLNGNLRKSVTISLTEHNKKLFLSRAFRDQGVRCVFIPAEYVTYFAVDYSHLGVGRSLVEEAKLHITRLAVLETADALANIENSISHTELTIALEKQTPEARHIVAQIRDEWYANNPTLHDVIGFNNISVDSILDRFKEQSLTIKVDVGDNKSIIAPDINARQMERDPLKTIDQSTRDALVNTICGYFNLKRSWLEDTGEGNDFQVEALAEQEMLRNQTAEWSHLFSKMISDFIRKHIRCNEPLVSDLITIIKENPKLYEKPDQGDTLDEVWTARYGSEEGKLTEQEKVEMVFIDFLSSISVELPSPALTDTLNKIEDKIDAIDKLVSKWVEISGGSKAIQKICTACGVEYDELLGQIKGAMLAKAFKRFNLPMPFEEILNEGDGGGILSMTSSINDLDANGIKFIKEYLNGGKKNMKELNKLREAFEKAKAAAEGQDEEEEEIPAEPSSPGLFDESALPPSGDPDDADNPNPEGESFEGAGDGTEPEPEKAPDDNQPFSLDDLPPE